MLFNGIDLSSYFRIKDIRGRGLINKEIETVSAAGMDGAYLSSVTTSVRYLEVDVRIFGNDLRKTIDDLNAVFALKETVPIVFPDEPDMTYYGIVEFSEESKEYRHLKTHDTTIYILRTDPYKYGPEETIPFEPLGYVDINIEGAAETEPVFELEVTKSTTFAMLMNNHDEYMMLGLPYDVDSGGPYTKYQRILTATGANMTGWTKASTGDVDGVVIGDMTTQNGRFQASSYGTGTGWHGPAIKRSFTSLKNFRLEAEIDFGNLDAAMVGRVEVYLLDVNGNQITKLAFKDTQVWQSDSIHEARIGDNENNHFFYKPFDWSLLFWDNFKGIMRIERENNVWSSYVSHITPNGIHYSKRIGSPIDMGNRHSANVAQVVIHVAQFGTYATQNMGVRSVAIDRINSQPTGVPYIAHAGDKITIDSKTSQAYINGEHIPVDDFGADFFTLKPGFNRIVVHPPNTFNARVKRREKYS